MRPEPGLWPFPWQMGKLRQRAAKCAISGSWGTSQDCLGPPAKVRIPKALQEDLACQTGSACFFPHNPQSKAGWFPGLSPWRAEGRFCSPRPGWLCLISRGGQGRSPPGARGPLGDSWGTRFSLLVVGGTPRNTARAIRIFRGIMILECKHICPQKSLIFPAVTNLLAGRAENPD